MIAGHEVPYLNTIGALNYLAEYVRPDIIVVGFLGGVFGLQYTDDELIKGGC
jgi:hypothetical protein